jgi:hypothetical protein
VSFINTGSVSNLVGLLNFNGGGTLGGKYNTAAGATTDFAAGDFTMGAPPSITGPGVCAFVGGTLTLTQDVPSGLMIAGGSLVLGSDFQDHGGITNLTLSGASLTSTNTVTGTFTWSAGTISGPLFVESGGVLNITGNVNLQNVLTNAGTVTMSGPGNMILYNNNVNYQGGIYNLTSGLWDIQTNAIINCACYGHEFFNNAGAFRRSQGAGPANVQVRFINTGSVSNLIGPLNFNSGGTLGGSYDTAAGATTDFAGGNFTMGAPPAITGPGVCAFVGGTLTLTQGVPPNLLLAGGNLVVGPAFQNNGGITNLTLSGASLTSTNTVTGTLTWSAGTISGPLVVESGGVLNITGNVNLQNVLTNAGTVTMSGPGNMILYNNNVNYQGGIYNLAGALWDIQTNAIINCACYGHEFFNNAGVFRRSQGAGPANVQVTFTNSGTVNALVGTLNFNAGFTSLNGTLSFGVSGLASFGQINFSGNVALNGTAEVAWLGGFLPAIGNSFAVLKYGSQTGTFANIALPAGTTGQGVYNPTVFSVMITNVSSQPGLPILSIALISPNKTLISWPTAAANFVLQTGTNLSSGSWTDVLGGISIVGTNNVFTNVLNHSSAFFRLSK